MAHFVGTALKGLALALAALLISGIAPISCDAQTNPTITFTWDAPASTNFSGYYVYYRTAAGAYSAANRFQVASSSATTYSTTALAAGTYYFRITAYSPIAESTPSNEVTVYSFSPSLQRGSAANRPYLVEIFSAGTSTTIISQTITSNASGLVRVNANSALPATFDLRVKTALFLGRKFTGRSISNTATLTALLIGDLDGNNAIDAADWNTLKADYYQSGRSSDLNSDSITNGADASYLTANWGSGQ